MTAAQHSITIQPQSPNAHVFLLSDTSNRIECRLDESVNRQTALSQGWRESQGGERVRMEREVNEGKQYKFREQGGGGRVLKRQRKEERYWAKNSSGPKIKHKYSRRSRTEGREGEGERVGAGSCSSAYALKLAVEWGVVM